MSKDIDDLAKQLRKTRITTTLQNATAADIDHLTTQLRTVRIANSTKQANNDETHPKVTPNAQSMQMDALCEQLRDWNPQGDQEDEEEDEFEPQIPFRPPVALYQKYNDWYQAQGKDLLIRRLPTDTDELEELSMFMATVIVRGVYLGESGSVYKPPLPPATHPYFPYWLPDNIVGTGGLSFEANICILEAWEEEDELRLIRELGG